jgi:hypothetical protein
MELREHRGVVAGLVVLLISLAHDADESRSCQSLKLTMNGARAAPGQADELRTLKAPLRLPKQQAEDALLHGREQRRGDSARDRLWG